MVSQLKEGPVKNITGLSLYAKIPFSAAVTGTSIPGACVLCSSDDTHGLIRK
jgi:hypothetical protein